MSASGAWMPPFRPWGRLVRDPTCTMTVNGPPEPVITAIAQEARRNNFRVEVASDFRSVTAKLSVSRLVVLNAVEVLSQTDFFTSPALTVAVADEGPWGTRFALAIRGAPQYWAPPSVPDALNRAAWMLACEGATVTVSPWETLWAVGRRRRRAEKNARRESEQRGVRS